MSEDDDEDGSICDACGNTMPEDEAHTCIGCSATICTWCREDDGQDVFCGECAND